MENTTTPQPKTTAEIKAENDALEAELIRKQKLDEMQRMAGRAVVSPRPEEPQETPKDRSKKFWAGTQIERMIDKHG